MKKNGFELTAGIVTLVLSVAALVLFFLSYTTGYYIFGQMQSSVIAALLGTGIAVEIAAIILRSKLPGALWPKLLTFAVTALLAAAAMLLVGARVEGIGNCIVTDYDSGHGGEEAIYMSLAASVLMLAAVVYNIIGSYGRDKVETSKSSGKVRWIGFGASALAVLLSVLIPTVNLVRPAGPSAPGGPGGASSGTYTVSFNQGNGNAETVPSYQFLCCDLGGMVRADSRMYIDVTLTLDGNGGYKLFSDGYVVESGKRAEIGDDTGLGLILTMNAEGTYVSNADGTVTTSVPTHAVFEMQTDTYSAQMKGAAGMAVNGNDEDGVYDSNDEPAVLDFVPETVWTLGSGTIENYRDANAGGVYTASFNANNGNLDDLPNYQFLPSDLGGFMAAENRLFVDVSLTLDGNGRYTLHSEAYVVESGRRAEIGDDTGLGMVVASNAEGTYTENADGTVTTSVPTHAAFEMRWDIYTTQLRDALGMEINGKTEEGVYDSTDEPAVLDFMPETVWTLDGSNIITWAKVGGEEPSDEPSDGLTITSDDGATTFTFYADGTYVFSFEAYGIEDAGTYTYEDGVLTVTNANGDAVTAEGDPLKLHYVTAVSDQLTGDFTIPAADLTALLSGGSQSGGLTVASDDGATSMIFNADGTYVFAFEAYGIEDAGTYSYEGGKLTVTNANGDAVTAEGDPLKLHYVTAVSDQLTGDFTIPAADLTALLSGGASAGDGLTVTSDDGATSMTFNADGTYVFAFEAYGIEDAGTYTYEGGVLTVTNANGDAVTAQGDPLKLHYVTAVSDQLTGDFTIPAADLTALLSGGDAPSSSGVTVPSDDGATSMTFNADGTYVFAFEAYGIEDAGTYTYEGGVLTVTNANGNAITADGNPLKFHYVTAVSDQLTGDFTIPAADIPQ